MARMALHGIFMALHGTHGGSPTLLRFLNVLDAVAHPFQHFILSSLLFVFESQGLLKCVVVHTYSEL